MVADSVSLSVVAQSAVRGTCELCATPDSLLGGVVTVRHGTGAVVGFVVCEQCAGAMGRVVAAIGSDGQLSQARATGLVDRANPKAVPRPRLQKELSIETKEVLGEANHIVVDDGGREYVVRFCGGRRS